MSTTTKERGKLRALVLTVGTGDRDKLEETLFVPLRKSIKKGEWDRIVLLPSRVTHANAEVLRSGLEGYPVVVCPLPRDKDEEDPDRCFAHFDTVISTLAAEGFDLDLCCADFTRGTKAMSAALVLAAASRGISKLRYISSAERDNRGTVVPGTEYIRETMPETALFRRRIDKAIDLLREESPGAAQAVLIDPGKPMFALLVPAHLRDEAGALWLFAAGLAAWDRHDYASAKVHLDVAARACGRDCVPADTRAHVETLAKPLPEPLADRPGPLRHLACDLLENARRCLRHGRNEDALFRAYRVWELVGQVRLFVHGLDSERLDPRHPAVASLQSSEESIVPDKNGRLMAGREKVARLLARLDDPLAMDLRNETIFGKFNPKRRNQSVLAHGYSAQGGVSLEDFEATLGGLCTLLLRDDRGNASRLANAKFPAWR